MAGSLSHQTLANTWGMLCLHQRPRVRSRQGMCLRDNRQGLSRVQPLVWMTNPKHAPVQTNRRSCTQPTIALRFACACAQAPGVALDTCDCGGLIVDGTVVAGGSADGTQGMIGAGEHTIVDDRLGVTGCCKNTANMRQQEGYKVYILAEGRGGSWWVARRAGNSPFWQLIEGTHWRVVPSHIA